MLEARSGAVLAELSAMVKQPAKDMKEVRNKVTELERKMKTVKEVTGTAADKNHAKSVLISLLDPVTRQHTTKAHGGSFDALKKAVMAFVNSAVGNIDDTQDEPKKNKDRIGRCEMEGKGFHDDANSGWEEEWGPENVGALGNGNCFNCGGK